MKEATKLDRERLLQPGRWGGDDRVTGGGKKKTGFLQRVMSSQARGRCDTNNPNDSPHRPGGVALARKGSWAGPAQAKMLKG